MGGVLALSPAAWSAIAAWLTLGVAGVAAWVGLRQLHQARQTHDEQVRPYIIVDVEPDEVDPSHLTLSVKNIGATPAFDVQFRFDPPIQSTLDAKQPEYPVAKAKMFTDGLVTMPPARQYRTLFEEIPALEGSDLPRSYSVTATYHDTRGQPLELTSVLDLSYGRGTTYVQRYGTHHVAVHLKSIAKHLERIAGPTSS